MAHPRCNSAQYHTCNNLVRTRCGYALHYFPRTFLLIMSSVIHLLIMWHCQKHTLCAYVFLARIFDSALLWIGDLPAIVLGEKKNWLLFTPPHTPQCHLSSSLATLPSFCTQNHHYLSNARHTIKCVGSRPMCGKQVGWHSIDNLATHSRWSTQNKNVCCQVVIVPTINYSDYGLLAPSFSSPPDCKFQESGISLIL